MGGAVWSFHARNAIMLDRSSKLPIKGDPLTDILRGLRLEGVEYGRGEMRPPWGLEFPAQRAARFHFIGSNGCWLRQPDGEWVELKAGDAVLLPRGGAHVLASEQGADTKAVAECRDGEICRNVYCLSNDGVACPSPTLLFYGTMYFNLDSLHPLLGMMPEVMRTHELEAYEPAIPHLLEAMAREVKMERLGSGGILARLADVLAATIIRSWVERGCGDASGWIAAVRDRDVGRVLAAIHLEPEREWTVESLARVMGASALSITLNLYIMDHIRKADFMQAESLRMALSMFAWTGGPTLGIWLYTRYGIYAAHGAVAVFVVVLLGLFWYYRLSDNAMIAPGKSRATNPLANIGRFIAQPRLRLAWLIAFGRSCYWTTFFVYGPLFMVIAGQGELAGGLLVSAGNALLFCAIFWGKAGKRFGARKVITLAFACMAVVLWAAGAVGEMAPLVTAGLLLAGALFAIAVDALGSTAFMRAVRAYERPQMAAVYRTYLDFSELTPPLVYSVVLVFFGIGSVFATLGCLTAVCAVITWRYLPKSM